MHSEVTEYHFGPFQRTRVKLFFRWRQQQQWSHNCAYRTMICCCCGDNNGSCGVLLQPRRQNNQSIVKSMDHFCHQMNQSVSIDSVVVVVVVVVIACESRCWHQLHHMCDAVSG